MPGQAATATTLTGRGEHRPAAGCHQCGLPWSISLRLGSSGCRLVAASQRSPDCSCAGSVHTSEPKTRRPSLPFPGYAVRSSAGAHAQAALVDPAAMHRHLSQVMGKRCRTAAARMTAVASQQGPDTAANCAGRARAAPASASVTRSPLCERRRCRTAGTLTDCSQGAAQYDAALTGTLVVRPATTTAGYAGHLP